MERFYLQVSPTRCIGSVDSLKGFAGHEHGGIRFSGWALETQSHRPVQKVLLVSPEGTTVGAAQTGFPRPDVSRASDSPAAFDAGYVGYVPADLYVKTVRPYAILSDGRSACPLLSDGWLSLATDASIIASFHKVSLTEGLEKAALPAIANVDLVRVTGTGESLEIVISGWAIDALSSRTAMGVEAIIDGEVHAAEYGIPRPDVAAASANPSLVNSGFRVRAAPRNFTSGSHSFTLRIVARDGGRYTETGLITFVE